MSGNLSADCLEPRFVFQTYHHLSTCFSHMASNINNTQKYYVNSSQTNNPFATVVLDCLSQYCELPDPNVGACSMYQVRNDNSNHSIDLGNPVAHFSSPTCDGINVTMDKDIGGPGVYISYLIQSLLLILLSIAVRITCSSPTIHKNKLGLQSSIVKYTMVEFQETSCFFMFVSQLATMIALEPKNNFIDATSLAQMNNNIAMVRWVSIAGILPVTYGMWMLRSARLNSWYTFLISTSTIAVATASYWRTREDVGPEKLVSLDNTEVWDKCGGNAPPLVYCSEPNIANLEQIVVIHHLLFAFGMFAYGMLVIVSLLASLRPGLSVGGMAIQVMKPEKRYSHDGYLPPHMLAWKILWRSITYVGDFACTGCVILHIALLVIEVQIDITMWDFGQIVAAAVWIPIISKYIYWTAFGTDSYSSARIPLPYRITQGPEPSGKHLSTSTDASGVKEMVPLRGKPRVQPVPGQDGSATSSSDAIAGDSTPKRRLRSNSC